MEVWREIYEAYCERNLDIQPPYPSAHEYIRTNRLEEKYGMTKEQIEEFENFLSTTIIDAEKRGFYAGMKIALRLISE